MAHINITHNGKYACFSTVTDTLITPFMCTYEYEKWRQREYGLLYYKPIIQRNTQTLKEALSNTRLNETHEDTLNKYAQCGISPLEIEQLLQEIEDADYTPQKNGNDQYVCPNCGERVTEGQRICSNENCGLQFFRAAGWAPRNKKVKPDKKTFYRYTLHLKGTKITCDILEDYEEHDGNYYKNHKPAIYVTDIGIVQEQPLELSLILTEPNKEKATASFTKHYKQAIQLIESDAAEKVTRCQTIIQHINNA